MGEEGRVIIIAEDHEDQRALAAMACRREGFGVLEAADGLELVELVRSKHSRGELGEVALVISDVMMPGLSGFDACETLTREGLHVPFLFMTALSDPETKVRALSLQSLGFFRKPFEFSALRHFLRERFAH